MARDQRALSKHWQEDEARSLCGREQEKQKERQERSKGELGRRRS